MEPEIKQHLDEIQANAIKSLDQLRSDWKQHYDELKAQGAPVAEIIVKVENALKRLDSVEANLSRAPVGDSPSEKKTLGEVIAQNEKVQQFADDLVRKGFSQGMKTFVPVGSFFPEVKTTITSSTVGSSTPGILIPQRMPGIVKPGVRTLRVRDLFPRFPTSNNAVEFVKENVFTNAASPTAETISKPESALTFTIDYANVKTIAHWIPVASQVLADFAALPGYLDTRLIEGLMDVEDYELIGGDGTGQHLSGLTTEATAYNTARNVAGDTRIDKLNHALAQLASTEHNGDGFILNTQDWMGIQLIKEDVSAANTGSYILGGPRGMAEPTIWGLPVATTNAVPTGQFFAGAFQRYCAIWDRMNAVVEVATQHADFFVRNMVAVRCEERIAFTVTRADAVIFGSY